jgi:maltose 6'-phosphate phosphatase
LPSSGAPKNRPTIKWETLYLLGATDSCTKDIYKVFSSPILNLWVQTIAKRRNSMGEVLTVAKHKMSIIACLCFFSHATWAEGFWHSNTCPQVFENEEPLRVLTLNLLFSEYPQRETRLRHIVEFLETQYLLGEEVHVVALQEVVGGVLDKALAARFGVSPVVGNTARELGNRLAERGIHYNLRTAVANGVAGIYSISNAILSRCEINFKEVKQLSKASEFDIGEELAKLGQGVLSARLKIPYLGEVNMLGMAKPLFSATGVEIDEEITKIGRSVLLTRLDIPHFGEVDVAVVHFCADCLAEERLLQARETIDFVESIQAINPAQAVLLLGDFNVHIGKFDDSFFPETYTLVTEEAGFTDVYAAAVAPEMVFCFEDIHDPPRSTDAGCTLGVSDIDDPLASKPQPLLRIDYIFKRGELAVRESKVIFNPLSLDAPVGPGVSDHSGLYGEFIYP